METSKKEKNDDGIVLKERYTYTCIGCGYVLKDRVAPSLFMQTGMANRGGVGCPECKKYNYVKIDMKTNTMVNDKEMQSEANQFKAKYEKNEAKSEG